MKIDSISQVPALCQLFAWIAIVAAPAACQTGAPPLPWWQRTQVVALGAAQPALEGLVTVTGWGDAAETAEGAAYASRRAGREHFSGRRVMGSISVYDAAYETYQQRPELAGAAVIDVDGKAMIVDWESTIGRPLAWGNTNSPVWQDFLMEQARRLVDAGVDGIVLDEVDGTAGSVGRGGSFGEPDMSMFRQYLASRYTAQQLSTQFGIGNIATFHYGNYIRARGLSDSWRTEPWKVPLSRDFTQFQQEASVSFIRRLTTVTREYALNTYNRPVAFTANLDGFYPSLLEYAGLLDYFTTELPISRNGYAPADRTIVDYKMGRALGGKAAWGLFSVATVADLAPRGPMNNLVRLLIAESYAARGALILPYRNYGWSPQVGPVWFEGDGGAQRNFYAFPQEYSPIFDDRSSVADVALIYSQATDAARWETYRPSYRGTALAMLDSQVQFDVVPLGAGSNVPDWPGDDKLAGYHAAVMPFGACVSESQVQRLLDWASRGGTLILTGETGACDLAGTQNRNQTARPFLTEGTYSLGKGKVVRIVEDLGVTYGRSRQASVRERLNAQLRASAQSPITAPNAPASLAILADRTLGGAAVLLHLLNGNYRVASDTLLESGPVQLQVNLPSGLRNAESLSAYLISPERSSPELLPLTVAGGQATLIHASVKTYDAILIAPAAVARQMADDAAATLLNVAAEAARRGDDLSRLTAVRTQIEAARASGNFLLARQLARNTSAELRRATRFRVMVDEGHDQRLTISPARAAAISPSDPGAALMNQLERTVASEFILESNESAPLTQQLLSKYDVLLMAAPRRALTDEEAGAVQAFVRGGGGLVALGGYGTEAEALNGTTAPYGITFSQACVLDTADAASGNIFNSTVADHPATRGVRLLSANNGGRLSVLAPSVALIQSSPTTWEDLNRDRRRNAAERMGPFDVAAASEEGAGRVVAAASRTFADSGSDYYGNDVFLAAALRWTVRSPGGTAPMSMSAASLAPGPLAPEMIVSTVGTELASTAATAAAGASLPASLDGNSLRLIDANLREDAVRLFSVSPTRVNWLVPGWAATGSAMVVVRNSSGRTHASVVEITDVAPGVFAANGNGMGAAAGTLLRVRDTAEPVREPLAAQSQGAFLSVPLEFGPESDRLYLSLEATGVRRASAGTPVSVTVDGQAVPVQSYGSNPDLPGLDRIEAGPLPRSLAGRGQVDVVVSAGGQTANVVRITFQ